MDDYGTDEACTNVFEGGLRWPGGVECPRCGGKTISRIAKRGQFDCDSCRYQFSVTAGTVMHDSHLPLRKWLLAVYLMCEAKKGISANQMKRTINVSYKTAWYLCHRIRAAMNFDGNDAQLTGTIEADETFIGGKPHSIREDTPGRTLYENRRLARQLAAARKVTVLGALSRGGEVRLRVAPNRSGASAAKRSLKAEVADDAPALYTDDYPAYRKLGDADTTHEAVNHSVKEWVRGDVHTNGIDSYGRCSSVPSSAPTISFRTSTSTPTSTNSNGGSTIARTTICSGIRSFAC